MKRSGFLKSLVMLIAAPTLLGHLEPAKVPALIPEEPELKHPGTGKGTLRIFPHPDGRFKVYPKKVLRCGYIGLTAKDCIVYAASVMHYDNTYDIAVLQTLKAYGTVKHSGYLYLISNTISAHS